MDIKTINTPEQLHQSIVKFLESDYSHEDLVKTYNDARKCMIRFRGDYSALPILPSFKDNALDGLQEVMDWCIKSSEVVNDIVFNLDRETITKIIRQFKKLRDFANRIVSLINDKLREQAQKEARAKVEKEYKNLNEKASSLKIEAMPLVRQAQVIGELQLKEQEILRRETKETVQIYLSKDPTFKNKLSHLHDEEVNEVFETLNKLAGSETPTGKLFDIYCKLKDIPLQRQFDDVGYAYSLNDLTDVICSGCSRLYTSVDNVIKTFEEIRTKAEEKAEKSQPQEKPAETRRGTTTVAESKEKGTRIGAVNIQNFHGILGDVQQAETLSIGDNARIHKNSKDPAKTGQDVGPGKWRRIGEGLKKVAAGAWQIFTKSFWEAVRPVIPQVKTVLLRGRLTLQDPPSADFAGCLGGQFGANEAIQADIFLGGLEYELAM